jgi:hypothetical protein
MAQIWLLLRALHTMKQQPAWPSAGRRFRSRSKLGDAKLQDWRSSGELVAANKEGAPMFRHKWQEGEGTVRDTRVSRFGPGDNAAVVTHFVMDVQPSTGEPFRAEVREPVTAGPFHAPIVGEVVKVKCDPARKEAKFDLSDKADQLARDQAALLAQVEREEEEDRKRFGSG